MRILVLDTGNPTHVTGGQSAFLRTVLPDFADDVVLGCPTYGVEQLGRLTQIRIGATVLRVLPICRIRDPRRRPLIPVRLRCALGAIRVRRLDRGLDCIWAHSVELAVVVSTMLPAIPLILHIHGAANPLSVSRYPLARFGPMQAVYAWAYGVAIRRAHRILSVDDAGIELCRRLVPGSESKALVVPNCFDSAVFSPDGRGDARAALGIPVEQRTLLFVGRLECHKGTDELIRTLRQLLQHGTDAHLYVAGEGTQREVMQMQADALGISTQCHFLGWVDSEQLSTYMRAADVLVLPSHAEGAPTVVLESLACGTPVVATDVGGLGALITSRLAGRLVQSPDPDELSDAIVDVLGTPVPPDVVAQTVAEFDVALVTKRIREVINEVTGQRRS